MFIWLYVGFYVYFVQLNFPKVTVLDLSCNKISVLPVCLYFTFDICELALDTCEVSIFYFFLRCLLKLCEKLLDGMAM